VLASLIFCMTIPILAMVMLVPSLKSHAPKSKNYRGVTVFCGLGIVWFIWLVALILTERLLPVIGLGLPGWVEILIPIFPLMAGSCVLGLFDDWAGDGPSKGFRGHLKAMFHGRLTTGGLKFFGIGILSLVVAAGLFYDPDDLLYSISKVLVATLVMALFANLMNLFDLRPGRVSKVYVLSLTVVMLLLIFVHASIRPLSGWEVTALALACLGPVLATWRYDLGEVGMLGDVGANSMGVLLGYLLVLALPFWSMVAAAVILLVINLLSEQVSFSRIIESVPWLEKLDNIGRKNIGKNDRNNTERKSS
jgi:hypothetical protein